MATKMFLKATTTHPRAKRAIPGTPDYRDMDLTQGAAVAGLNPVTASGTNIRQFGAGGTARLAFWGERVAAPVTLSGTMTWNVWASSSAQAFPHRLRMTLSKITAGGSDVETDIGTADSADIPSAMTAFNFPMSIPDIALAVGERLLVRAFVFRVDGATISTVPLFHFNGLAAADGDSWLQTTQTITFKPNTTVLSLRRTTATGIGAFMDLLPTFGVAAFTTAVVNTVPSGTEIVWTKTAGGITAEWLSPRVKSQWDLPPTAFNGGLDGRAMMKCTTAALESAAAANVQPRLKVFVRHPDGTEPAAFWYDSTTNGIELTTTMANNSGTAGESYTQVSVGEDDRLVVRCYIVNVGTMGSGTATLGYDGPINTTGTTQLECNDLPDFKAESDPPKGFVVPSGQATMGLSNGQ